MGKIIEYLGPHRPPWGDKAPLKIVTYFDPAKGIDSKANLQFVVGKDRLCLCKNVPEDAAFKLTNSSPVFIEFEEGTKYSEKRIVGLKVKAINKDEVLQDKITELEKKLAEERKKNALAAQQEHLAREAEARDNPPLPPIESKDSDAKETEKKELGVPA